MQAIDQFYATGNSTPTVDPATYGGVNNTSQWMTAQPTAAVAAASDLVTAEGSSASSESFYRSPLQNENSPSPNAYGCTAFKSSPSYTNTDNAFVRRITYGCGQRCSISSTSQLGRVESQRQFLPSQRRHCPTEVHVATTMESHGALGDTAVNCSRLWTTLQDIPVSSRVSFASDADVRRAPISGVAAAASGIPAMTSSPADGVSSSTTVENTSVYVPMTPALATQKTAADGEATVAPSLAACAAATDATVPQLPRVYEVQVKLCNMALWRQFHACTNEMIITKSGRSVSHAFNQSAYMVEVQLNG